MPADHNAHIATIDVACSCLQVSTGPPRDGVGFRLDTVGDLLNRLAVAPVVEWRATPAAGRGFLDVGATGATITTLLRPLVQGLAERRLLGRRALWASVADAVAYPALETAKVSELEPEHGMAICRKLVAAAGAPGAAGVAYGLER